MDNMWEPIKDNGHDYKDTYHKVLEAVTKERVNILDECLFSYLAIVQKWDVEKVKLYLKNTKNVKVKGAEFFKRINRQGHDLEYWYFKDDLIMVTDKITLEIYQVGDWINGK